MPWLYPELAGNFLGRGLRNLHGMDGQIGKSSVSKSTVIHITLFSVSLETVTLWCFLFLFCFINSTLLQISFFTIGKLSQDQSENLCTGQRKENTDVSHIRTNGYKGTSGCHRS